MTAILEHRVVHLCVYMCVCVRTPRVLRAHSGLRGRKRHVEFSYVLLIFTSAAPVRLRRRPPRLLLFPKEERGRDTHTHARTDTHT